MNAQYIALASFGNAYLKTGILPAGFYPDNPIFERCNSISFIFSKNLSSFSKNEEFVIAKTPNQWFEYLKKNGCKKIGLYYAATQDQSFGPAYKNAGFVDRGGTWLMETIYDKYSNYWAAINYWAGSHYSNTPDNKMNVEYKAALKQEPITNLRLDLVEIKTALENALIKIKDFAQQHELNLWAQRFEKSIIALNSAQPNADYTYKDLIDLKAHSLISKQILFASRLAFVVFGGQGSWNEIGFETKEENAYCKHLTFELYDIVIKGVVAAIND